MFFHSPGTLELRLPGSWEASPRSFGFSLTPQRMEQKTIDIQIPHAEVAGRKRVVAAIRLADGGYYLVGCRHRVPPVFAPVRWGTEHALADTRANVRRAGLSECLLAPGFDVDTEADLERLRASLEASELKDMDHAPRTRSLLTSSC